MANIYRIGINGQQVMQALADAYDVTDGILTLYKNVGLLDDGSGGYLQSQEVLSLNPMSWTFIGLMDPLSGLPAYEVPQAAPITATKQ